MMSSIYLIIGTSARHSFIIYDVNLDILLVAFVMCTYNLIISLWNGNKNISKSLLLIFCSLNDRKTVNGIYLNAYIDYISYMLAFDNSFSIQRIIDSYFSHFISVTCHSNPLIKVFWRCSNVAEEQVIGTLK